MTNILTYYIISWNYTSNAEEDLALSAAAFKLAVENSLAPGARQKYTPLGAESRIHTAIEADSIGATVSTACTSRRRKMA